MSDQLKAILDATPTSNRVRAAVWDMFYQNQNADELQGALDALPVPPETKARVLQLKMGDQPSAVGRFVSNAADVLNPVTAIQGLYNAVRHPIQTGSNVLQMHGEQASKARQAFGEGRYDKDRKSVV